MTETVTARRIREENEFGGVRVTLTAILENARIPLQVDIGFGDAVVPEPTMVQFPTMLKGSAPPHILVYQKETTIAEKLHALVELDRTNSRMKDFFDLYILCQEFPFAAAQLSRSVRDVFARRGTAVPIEIPDGMSAEFAADPVKIAQWKSFLNRNVSSEWYSLTLAQVITKIAEFLLPILKATVNDDSNSVDNWLPGGPWGT